VSEVKAGQKVLVKRHLDVDAVPYGPGVYEVADEPKAGQISPDVAKRATAKQGNAEVYEEPKKQGGKG
jgi:predicted sugar kinase